MTITINNSSLLTSVSASQQDLENRIQSLEETTYEYEIFQLIASGTSGSVTIPVGSSVRLDQYPNAGDCLVVKVDSNNRPLDAPAVTSGSVVITSTFDSAGNYSLSGTPNAYPVAIIYQVSVAAKDVGNIALDSIVAVESVGLKNGGTVYGEIYIDDQNYGSVPLREGATQGMSTGVLSGGVLSITGGTTFQVSAGSGQIVNTATTPNTYTPVTWGVLSATNTNTTVPFTHILVSPNGVLIQQTSEPTMLQYIQNIYIGVIANVSGVQVASASRVCSAASVGNQMQEFMRISGAINVKDAIKVSANGSNTQLNSSAGNIWREGANANNSLATPNTASVTAKTPLQFVQYYTNSSGDIVAQTALTSTLITNVYNNAGILTTIPVNKWQIIRIYMSPNGYGLLLTGSNIYNSLAAAESAIQNEQFVEPPLLADQAFIGWVIIKGQTTNLSNTTDNLIINATKYGVSGGSAATGYMLNTQYDPAGISEQLVGITATQTITNKTIDGSSNTLSNIPQSAVTGLTTALDSKLDDTQATTVGLSVLGAASQLAARSAIGAGTSSFSGSYTDLANKPTLGTAAAKDIPATGDAASTEVVLGSDSRLTDTRSPATYDQTKAYSTGQTVLVGSAVAKANSTIPANTTFAWGTTGATWSYVPPAVSGHKWAGVYTAGVSYTTNDIVASGSGIAAQLHKVSADFTSVLTYAADFQTSGGVAVSKMSCMPLGYASLQGGPLKMLGASSTSVGRTGLVPTPVVGNHISYLRGDGTFQNPTQTYDTTKAYVAGETVYVGNLPVVANADIAANTAFSYGTSGATWSPVLPQGYTWRGVYANSTAYAVNDVYVTLNGMIYPLILVMVAFTSSTSGLVADTMTIGGVGVNCITPLTMGPARMASTAFQYVGASASAPARVGVVPAATAGQQNSLFKGDGSFSSGLVEKSTGVLGVGQGIYFPASQNPSSDPNTLDDYEEGYWTPTLFGFNGTISAQSCMYTKIGRLVHVWGILIPATTFATTVASSYVQLPFTAPDGPVVSWSTGYVGQPNAIIVNSRLFTPTVAATSATFYFSVTYNI